jgi:hypothetical protein
MHLVPDRFSLPESIRQSDDFKALSIEAQHEFLARVRYIVEIAEKISLLSEAEDFLFELENIELDCLVNLSVRPQPKDHVSAWLVHSSWTFECNSASLAESVDKDFRRLIASPMPNENSDLKDITIWVNDLGMGLKSQLIRLTNARNFCAAIGALICVDAILATLVLGLTLTRFNTRIRD